MKNARISMDRLHKIREDLTTERLEKYYKKITIYELEYNYALAFYSKYDL